MSDATDPQATPKDGTEVAGQAGQAGAGGTGVSPDARPGSAEGGATPGQNAAPGLKQKPIDHELAEATARRFHVAYEALAPTFSYETREESAKPWEDVPEKNRELMIATVYKLMDDSDIVVFGAGELEALAEVTTDILMRLYDGDDSVGTELSSAVRKLHFAFGRCYGMTDYDMGIEENHGA